MENALPIPRLLELQGVGSELACTLSDELGPCLDASTLAPELAKRLEMILPFDSSWSGLPEVWPLFGAPRSGKTSIAAGLAAWSVLAYGARVVLIEPKAESVRGSGLREWSRKIGCEYVSLTDTEARQGIVPLRLSLNYDLILLDGISRIHPAIRKGLCGWRIRRHIVLDAGQLCSLNRLEHLRGARLILTKLDKAPDLGSALTLAHKSSLPLAFFSTGPAIPKNLEPAGARRLAQLLTRLVH